MEQLEITPYRFKPVHALSGGQKKQVSIADILVMKPEIVIMDEPASALDPKHTSLVNHAVSQMTAEGITVMMATHDVNYAFSWADEIIILKDGRVLDQGDPVSVFSNKELLHDACLEQPAVLTLFDALCQKKILKNSLEIPRNMNTLIQYIQKYGGL